MLNIYLCMWIIEHVACSNNDVRILIAIFRPIIFSF